MRFTCYSNFKNHLHGWGISNKKQFLRIGIPLEITKSNLHTVYGHNKAKFTLLLIFAAIKVWKSNDDNIANLMNMHCHVDFIVVRHYLSFCWIQFKPYSTLSLMPYKSLHEMITKRYLINTICFCVVFLSGNSVAFAHTLSPSLGALKWIISC